MRLLWALRSGWRPQSAGKIHAQDSLAAIRQDVAPPGGYAPINYTRIPARTLFNGPRLVAAFLAVHLAGLAHFRYKQRQFERRTVEENSARMAMEPMLLAEYDRQLIREVGRARADEEELFEGQDWWEVGTWLGRPVYLTDKEDQ